MRTTVAIIVVSYLLVMLTWGAYSFYRRNTSTSSADPATQYVGNRSFGTLPLLATLIAAYASGYTLLAASESGFRGGLSGPIWYSIGVAVPLLLFVWPLNLLSRIREAVPGGVTMIQYIGVRFGERARLVSLVVVTIANIVYVISIVLVIGIVLVALLDVSLTVSVFIGGIALFVYTSLSGYSGLVWGHVYQAIVAYIAIATALVLTVHHTSIEGSTFEFLNAMPAGQRNIFGWGPSNILDFFVGLLAFAVAMPQTWQRIYSAKDNKAIERAMKLFPLCWAPIAVGSGLLGVAAAQEIPDTDPGQASTNLVMEVFPDWAAVIFMLGALALVFSSGDAALNNISSNIQIDIIGRYSNLKMSRAKNIAVSSGTQFVLVAIGIVGTLLLTSPLDLLMIQSAVYIALLMPLYLGLTWKGIHSTAAVAGIVVGICVQAVAFFLGVTPVWNLVTVVGSLATVLVVSILLNGRDDRVTVAVRESRNPLFPVWLMVAGTAAYVVLFLITEAQGERIALVAADWFVWLVFLFAFLGTCVMALVFIVFLGASAGRVARGRGRVNSPDRHGDPATPRT